MEDKARLGRMLVGAGLLTEEQLQMAVDFQHSVGGKLGAIITKLGFIEDQTLTNFIARQQGIRQINLEELVIPENLVKRVPRSLIERHHILPVHFESGVLTMATSDPFDFEAMEELQLALDYKIEINLAPRSQILRCINEMFSREEERGPFETTKEDLLREIDAEGRPGLNKVPAMFLREALIPLLIEKGVISEEELHRKAREIEQSSRTVAEAGP